MHDDPYRAMDGNARKRALEQQMETAKRHAIRARQLVTNLEAHAKDCEEDYTRAMRALDAHNTGAELPVDEAEPLSDELEAAVAAAEVKTLNGFPLALNLEANTKFEELLKAKVLTLVRQDGSTERQVIYPGTNGTGKNVFENKDLFKEVVPRFFWQPDKVWAREAPEGWLR